MKVNQGTQIILGNFNTIKGSEDMLYGNPVQEYAVADFNDIMLEIGLTKL